MTDLNDLTEQNKQNAMDLPIYDFDLDTGVLCLDFINTAKGRAEGYAHEQLLDYRYLLLWGLQSHALSPDQTRHLLDKSHQHPEQAANTLEQIKQFREALYRLVTSEVHATHPQDADLAIFNAQLASAQPHARLIANDDKLTWGWDEQALPLDRVLWDVTRSAADLLTSEELSFVRTCGRPDCDWLFLDTSKNHSRRWCSMKTCGNRDKVRRHYARQKHEQE